MNTVCLRTGSHHPGLPVSGHEKLPIGGHEMPAGGQENCPPVAMRSAHFLTEPTAP